MTISEKLALEIDQFIVIIEGFNISLLSNPADIKSIELNSKSALVI